MIKYVYPIRYFSAGFVSNGEFNYLRTKGYIHPLSVLTIRTDVRRMYSRAKESVLLDMVSPVGMVRTLCLGYKDVISYFYAHPV